MCLIVHRPSAGAHIPDAVIDSNLRINDDGFGLAWRTDDSRLLYKKFAPADWRAFRDLLKKIDKTDSEYMAHFRMTTHGPSNEEMAHPYIYKDKNAGDVLVFHNGIIPIATDESKSDTWTFVEEVLRELPPEWWNKPAYAYLVQQGIGYSRMSLMTTEESVRLTGDNKWVVENGIYYSTEPFKYNYKVYTGGRFTDDDMYKDYTDSWGKPSPKAVSDSDEKKEGSSVGSAISGLYRPSVGTVSAGTINWTHVGHEVVPLEDVDETDGEAYGSVWCTKCDTEGEYYMLGGKVYIELSHYADDDTDDEVSLLPDDVKLLTTGESNVN